MFVHHVFFWLKPDADRKIFVENLKALCKIDLVQQGRVGEKVASPREVVESGYDYSLLLMFGNKADHDQYQDNHPEHNVFIANCKEMWTRVQVYDAQDI